MGRDTMSEEGISTTDIFPILGDSGRITEEAIEARAAHPNSVRLALDELVALGVVTRTEDGWVVADASALATFT